MVDTPRAHEQALPKRNDSVSMHELVIQELRDRAQIGMDTYGAPLQAFNGRDPGRDLTEEMLDAAVYAKQLSIELRAYKDATEEILRRLDEYPYIDGPRTREVLSRHGVVV